MILVFVSSEAQVLFYVRVEDVVKLCSGCVCLYALGVIVHDSYERPLEVKQERRVGIESGRQPDTCGENV